MTDDAITLDHVPCWDKSSPETGFEIFVNDSSGRIPVTRLEHWKDFVDLIESPFFERQGQTMLFRGHRRHDWELSPSLGRHSESGIVKREVAEKQLRRFRKAIRGRTQDYALFDEDTKSESDELWSIGQHHGLHTPLLDWTYSPYVALFFAFSEEDQKDELDNPYRAVYVLNKSFVKEYVQEDDSEDSVRIVEPKKDDYGRLVSQAGLFTFSPYDNTLEGKLTEAIASEDFPDRELLEAGRTSEGEDSNEANIIAKYICKIYIKNEDQRNCVKFLRRMNVHHASLFPDLLGASAFCNNATYEDALKETSLRPLEEIPITENDVQVAAAYEIEEASTETVKSVSNLLLHYYAGTQHPDMERIERVAGEVSAVLSKIAKVVDWDKREPLQAEVKNKLRFLLRKYSYPENAREQLIAQLLKLKLSEASNERN